MPTTAPFGTWKSPITTDQLVENVVGLAYPLIDGPELYWAEGRASEGGRQAIVRRRTDGTTEELLPRDYSARTMVHEYGGLSYAVKDGVVYFANLSDQRLYRRDPDGSVLALSPEPPTPSAYRYAAPVLSPDGSFLVCVRERHLDDEVLNDLVRMDTSEPGEAHVLVSGHDFYSAPVISADGTRLAFLCWDLPHMPWDGTELYQAVLSPDGSLGEPHLVAGSETESICQPRYAPDGVLHFISDRSGWWNLYRDDGHGGEVVLAKDAEFAGPDWVFGLSSYAFSTHGTVLSWSENGLSHLGVLDNAVLREIDAPYDLYSGIQAGLSGFVAIAGSATESPALIEVSLPGGDVRVHARSRAQAVDAAYLSVPLPITFPTTEGRVAHALFYAPSNADFVGPETERPPLIVASHGGPTSATAAVLSYQIQYWTSRGFALVDVNYGGSSGYGRAYRAQLDGKWGIVDVEDCIAAARHLAQAGEVDGDRLLIHGGSAGGYTTLCALTFHDVFAAGASYFGVADVGALARDTHKFESRYLDRLIGPWPEAEDVYNERSPIFHVEQLSTPLILFQGLDDKVVPPNQAEMMRDALRAKGAAVAHVTYEGEGHGFRRAENIKRTAEAELYFYAQVLGFVPADEIEPVEIENLAPSS